MSEAVTQVETKPAAPAAADSIVVVTGETMEAFTEARGSGSEFKSSDAPKPAPQASAEEGGKVDEHAEAVEEGADPGAVKPEKKLSKWQIENNERFSKLTAERNAAAERATAAERAATELRTKYEPPAAIPESEPDPTKYTDAKLYAEDYSNWKDGQRRMSEAAEAQRREGLAVQQRFEKDRDAFKATVPDWDARAALKANVQMHGEVISAIMESDHPAQIFYEMTPEDCDRINKLPTMRARLREITRMEAKISKGGAEAAPAAVAAKAAPIEEAEVSRAPAPINPIKAVHQEPSNKVDKDGIFTGSQDEYEKFRREGKIN